MNDKFSKDLYRYYGEKGESFTRRRRGNGVEGVGFLRKSAQKNAFFGAIRVHKQNLRALLSFNVLYHNAKGKSIREGIFQKRKAETPCALARVLRISAFDVWRFNFR